MRFNPDIAEIRFGFGRAPHVAAPQSRGEMYAGLTSPDLMAARFPIESFGAFGDRLKQVRAANKTRRESKNSRLVAAANERRQSVEKSLRQAALGAMGTTLLRASQTSTAFRERLVWFWADHFTAQGKRGILRWANAAYIDQAIRPNITLRFADLLQAAVLHPLMLQYLDQVRSMGPNSRRGRQTGGARGLNENLAREVLELHTVGVDGPYTQDDVRALAELFTGISVDRHGKAIFRPAWAEPGRKHVLGLSYDGAVSLASAKEVLDDLARRPETAEHIARKLAVHFLADAPDQDLVAHVAAAFRETDGNLLGVYEALLDHPAAWTNKLSNAKPPADFVASAMRALAPPLDRVQNAKPRELRRVLFTPMERMGQRWQRPVGPDGWEEDDAHWFTPQGLAERINWAMSAPALMVGDLPDPRVFVEMALGTFADERVRFAAAAAEQRSEAIGIVLMSSAFQRR